MRYGTIALLSATALALAGCGHKDETTTTTNSVTAESGSTTVADTNIPDNSVVAAPVTSGGQAFANTAATSDAFEIAESQLATTSAHSAAIKSFAKKMIEAHTGSTAKLKTVTAGLSPAITPDPTLTPDLQSKVDALKAKTGADFDTAYAADQVAAHQATLDALKSYSTSGDVAALKTFATGLIPTVTAHLNMAKGLKP
jgi:putative membrane protein